MTEWKQAKVRIGDWIVDPATRRACSGRREARLSPKAMGVLTALVEAEGGVVRRDALMDAVWPGVTVGEEVLTHAVAELRRSLGDDFREPGLIETVHKSGYRLMVRPMAYDAPPVAAGGDDDAAHANGEVAPFALFSALDGQRDLAATNAPHDMQSYAAYLEACQRFDRGGAGNTREALRLFSQIVRDEPFFVPGYAGLAKTLAFIAMYYDLPGDHIAAALAVCDRGSRLNDRSPELLAARGTVFSAMGETRRAMEDFTTALGLAPRSADTHYLLGRACLASGDFAIAATVQEHAARLRSDDFHSLVLAAKARRRLGDEVAALADLVRAMQRIDSHLQAHPDDFRAQCDRACCLVELGRADEACSLFEALRDHQDPMAYYLVCFLARSGQVDLAIDHLEETVDSGWSHGPFLIVDPDLDALRGERRFDRLSRVLNAG